MDPHSDYKQAIVLNHSKFVYNEHAYSNIQETLELLNNYKLLINNLKNQKKKTGRNTLKSVRKSHKPSDLQKKQPL